MSSFTRITADRPGGQVFAYSKEVAATEVLVEPSSTPPGRQPPWRGAGGLPLFVEDHTGISEGMFNDGSGSASTDYDVMLNGRPTTRLDPQLNLSSSTANSATAKVTTQVVLNTTTPQSIVAATINGTPTIPTSGPFQVVANDGNTYIGTYTGQSYSSPNLTLTGCLLMAAAATPSLVIPGTSVYNQTGATCTVPAYGTAPTVGLLTAGNPWVNCGISADTAGVVYKRRIADNFSARFGIDTWVRWTGQKSAGASSSGNGSGIANACWSMSLYNRNGADYCCNRIMIQTNVMMANGSSNGQSPDNGILWVVTGGTTSAPLLQPLAVLSMQSFNQHSWDPINGAWDRAGIWHYAKIASDFVGNVAISVQFDDMIFPLGFTLPAVATIGSAKVMHFSTEFKQQHATGNSDARAYVNIGPVTGTME